MIPNPKFDRWMIPILLAIGIGSLIVAEIFGEGVFD